MKKLYTACFIFLLHTATKAQTINVSGECMTGTISLSPIAELVAGKIAYEGTGTVAGNAEVGVSIFWIGVPDNVWVLAYDGQPFFKNPCNTTQPLTSPNLECPWLPVEGNTCEGPNDLSIAGSGVLAVRLTSFTGVKLNGEVLLNWKTASEANNKSFDVQRSADGINWQAIGSVPGSIQSNTELQYHFTDRVPINGKNYYRLLQKDLDGRSSYSGIIRIEISGIPSFRVFNTAAPGIYQVVMQSGQPVELGLYDAAAKKVWSMKAAQGTQLLDLTSYPSGIYLLQSRTNNELRTEKIINP